MSGGFEAYQGTGLDPIRCIGSHQVQKKLSILGNGKRSGILMGGVKGVRNQKK